MYHTGSVEPDQSQRGTSAWRQVRPITATAVGQTNLCPRHYRSLLLRRRERASCRFSPITVHLMVLLPRLLLLLCPKPRLPVLVPVKHPSSERHYKNMVSVPVLRYRWKTGLLPPSPGFNVGLYHHRGIEWEWKSKPVSHQSLTCYHTTSFASVLSQPLATTPL